MAFVTTVSALLLSLPASLAAASSASPTLAASQRSRTQTTGLSGKLEGATLNVGTPEAAAEPAVEVKKFKQIRNQYCGGEIISGWVDGTVDQAREFCQKTSECKAFVYKKGHDTWRPISKLTAQMADKTYDCFRVDEPHVPLVAEDDLSFPRRKYRRSRYLYCGGTITGGFEAGTIGEAKRFCDKHAKEHPEKDEGCMAFVYNKYSQTFRGIMQVTAKQDDDKYDCYRVKQPIQYVEVGKTSSDKTEL